jgi:hypothetical protein
MTMAKLEEIQVIAHKHSIGRFTVKAATRKEVGKAIEETLRSSADIVWSDSDTGISVTCIRGDEICNPRRRFLVPEEE